jgi:hypothetical protein
VRAVPIVVPRRVQIRLVQWRALSLHSLAEKPRADQLPAYTRVGEMLHSTHCKQAARGESHSTCIFAVLVATEGRVIANVALAAPLRRREQAVVPETCRCWRHTWVYMRPKKSVRSVSLLCQDFFYSVLGFLSETYENLQTHKRQYKKNPYLSHIF